MAQGHKPHPLGLFTLLWLVFLGKLIFVTLHDFTDVVVMSDVPMFQNSYHPIYFGVAALVAPIVLGLYFYAYDVITEYFATDDTNLLRLRTQAFSKEVWTVYAQDQINGILKVVKADCLAVLGSLIGGAFMFFITLHTRGSGTYHAITVSYAIPLFFMLTVPFYALWKRNDYYYFEKDIIQRHLGRQARFEVESWSNVLHPQGSMRRHKDLLNELVDDVKAAEGPLTLAIRGDELNALSMRAKMLADQIWVSAQAAAAVGKADTWQPEPKKETASWWDIPARFTAAKEEKEEEKEEAGRIGAEPVSVALQAAGFQEGDAGESPTAPYDPASEQFHDGEATTPVDVAKRLATLAVYAGKYSSRDRHITMLTGGLLLLYVVLGVMTAVEGELRGESMK